MFLSNMLARVEPHWNAFLVDRSPLHLLHVSAHRYRQPFEALE